MALLLTGLSGFAIHLLATRWGIGLSPDSATYIAGARGILAGQGYGLPQGGGIWVPTTLWPPFYSTVLAIPGVLGVDPLLTARWLNGILLAASTILVGLLIARGTGSRVWAAPVGAAAFLLYSDTFYLHGWAWSEGLFIALGLASLLLADHYGETGRTFHLLLASGLAALALLTRYAGAAFVASGALTILLAGPPRQRFSGRALRTVAFAALALAPIALWSIRNLAVSGTLTGPDLVTRGIPQREWEAALWIVSLWFLPGRVADPWRSVGMISIGLGFLILALRAAIPAVHKAGGRSRVGLSLVLFLLAYSGLMLATKGFLRPLSMHDPRHYVVLYAAAIIVGAVGLDRALASWRKGGGVWSRAWLRWPAAGLAAGLGVLALSFHLVHAAKWVEDSYVSGMGYSNDSWRASRILQYVAALPVETPVASNSWDALYVLTNREVYPLPSGNPPGGEGWIRLQGVLEDQGGVIAFFFDPSKRGLADERTLMSWMSFCDLLRAEEGRIMAPCEPPSSAGP